jgi:5'-phosphate synthase pdxT subunit
MSEPKIGVMAMQGAFIEHGRSLERCGCRAVEVRRPQQLDELDGLIIPGGESTTIGKLLELYRFPVVIKEKIEAGMPVYGTGAGLILLAKDLVKSDQPRLGVMDISVLRNGYGRQVDSFEAELEIKAIGEPPFRGVFIRAPLITRVGPGVEVLGSFDGAPVVAREGNLLVSSFHPELTGDNRLHRYFVEMVR